MVKMVWAYRKNGEMSNTTKWPDKLEYRGRDPREDPERLGKKIYRRYCKKEELNELY
jgi:hypothetical protein